MLEKILGIFKPSLGILVDSKDFFAEGNGGGSSEFFEFGKIWVRTFFFLKDPTTKLEFCVE